MSSLLRREKAFQRLKRLILHSQSEHIIVRETAHFLAGLEQAGRPELFLSYYLELSDLLLSSSLLSGLSHQAPEVTELLQKAVNTLAKSDLQGLSQRRVADRFRDIAEAHHRILSCLGQENETQSELLPKSFAAQTGGEGPVTVYVPVVEKLSFEGEDLQAGILESFSLELEARQRQKTENLFYFGNHPLDADNEILTQAETAYRAARSVAETVLNRPLRPYSHRLHFHFQRDHRRYEGQSFGLALAVTAALALLNEHAGPKSFRLTGRPAFSALLNSDGRILPVSAASLREKITSLFFSDADSLCLAEEDLPAAEKYLAPLQKDYPGRRLRLFGLKNLGQLFDSPELLLIGDRPLKSRLMRLLQRRRHTLLTGLLSLIVLALSLILSLPLHRTLVHVELTGGGLKGLNNHGKKLWYHPLSTAENDGSSSEITEAERRSYMKKLVLTDLDGDRESEVIFGTVKSDKNSSETVTCLNSRGQLLWTYTEDRAVTWSNGHTYKPPFLLRYLKADTVSGKHVMAVFSHAPYFPTKLILLDALGNTAAEYLHSGHLNAGLWVDFDRDSRPDILFGGVNNAYNKAVLGLLKPDSSLSQRPAQPDWVPSGMSLVYYALLPRMDWLDLGEVPYRYHVMELRYTGSDSFQLHLSGGQGSGREAILSFSLDFKFLSLTLPDDVLEKYLNQYGKHFWDVHSHEDIEALMSDIEWKVRPEF